MKDKLKALQEMADAITNDPSFGNLSEGLQDLIEDVGYLIPYDLESFEKSKVGCNGEG